MSIDIKALIEEARHQLASNQWTTGWAESLADRLLDALEQASQPVTEEQEWEYGIEHRPGDEEFEGLDFATIQRHVENIRREEGPYNTTVRAVRRRPAGDPEPVETESQATAWKEN